MLLGKTALSKFNPPQQICWQCYAKIAISTMINMSKQTKASHFFRRLTVNVQQLLAHFQSMANRFYYLNELQYLSIQ